MWDVVFKLLSVFSASLALLYLLCVCVSHKWLDIVINVMLVFT